jgi:nucleoside-diphosphate-sugar epimerase
MICVVGSTGFLGSSLVNHFEAAGSEVAKISWAKTEKSQVIAQLEDLITRGNLTSLLLCGASQVSEDDYDSASRLVESNVLYPTLAASLLLEKSPTTKLVHFGTSWQNGVGGRDETFNLYASSKSAAECLLEHFAHRGLPVISLRLFDTYGPSDPRRKLLNLAMQTIKSGSRLDTTLGKQLFELVHIRDVLRAVELALDLNLAGTRELIRHDVGPRTPMTVREVMELLCEIAGVDAADHFNFGALPYRSREKMEAVPLRFLPGWVPEVELQDGLREVYLRDFS